MSTFGLAKRPTPDPHVSLAAAAADVHATPGDSAVVLVDALWRSFHHGTPFVQRSTMTAITITHLMRVFIASIGYNFVIEMATKPSRPGCTTTSTRSPTFGSPTIFVCALTCTRKSGPRPAAGPMTQVVAPIDFTMPLRCICVGGAGDSMMEM